MSNLNVVEEQPPKKKRGRPPIYKNNEQGSNAVAKGGSKYVKKSKQVQHDNNDDVINLHDSDGNDKSQQRSSRHTTPHKKTNTGGVYNTPQSQNRLAAVNPYSSLSRRSSSRRSKAIDNTREIIVLMPGDDPVERLGLDATEAIEFQHLLLEPSTDYDQFNSDDESHGPGNPVHSYASNSSSRALKELQYYNTSANDIHRSHSHSRNNSISLESTTAHGAFQPPTALQRATSTATVMQEVFTPGVREHVTVQEVLARLKKAEKSHAKKTAPTTSPSSTITKLEPTGVSAPLWAADQGVRQSSRRRTASASSADSNSGMEGVATTADDTAPATTANGLVGVPDTSVGRSETQRDEQLITSVIASRRANGYFHETVYSSGTNKLGTNQHTIKLIQAKNAQLKGQPPTFSNFLNASTRVADRSYVDYDADSSDEEFVMGPLLRCINQQQGQQSANANSSSKSNSNSKSTISTPQLVTLRCFEHMLSALERTLELASKPQLCKPLHEAEDILCSYNETAVRTATSTVRNVNRYLLEGRRPPDTKTIDKSHTAVGAGTDGNSQSHSSSSSKYSRYLLKLISQFEQEVSTDGLHYQLKALPQLVRGVSWSNMESGCDGDQYLADDCLSNFEKTSSIVCHTTLSRSNSLDSHNSAATGSFSVADPASADAAGSSDVSAGNALEDNKDIASTQDSVSSYRNSGHTGPSPVDSSLSLGLQLIRSATQNSSLLTRSEEEDTNPNDHRRNRLGRFKKKFNNSSSIGGGNSVASSHTASYKQASPSYRKSEKLVRSSSSQSCKSASNMKSSHTSNNSNNSRKNNSNNNASSSCTQLDLSDHPIYTIAQLSVFVPESRALTLLKEVYTAYSHNNTSAKNGEVVTVFSSKPVAGAAKASAALEAQLTQQFRMVYTHWLCKRSKVQSSFLRAHHHYMMDLWKLQDNLTVPLPGEFTGASIVDAHDKLSVVRSDLDRVRLIVDRVRRREKLKRELVQRASELLDCRLSDWAAQQNGPNTSTVEKDCKSTPDVSGAGRSLSKRGAKQRDGVAKGKGDGSNAAVPSSRFYSSIYDREAPEKGWDSSGSSRASGLSDSEGDFSDVTFYSDSSDDGGNCFGGDECFGMDVSDDCGLDLARCPVEPSLSQANASPSFATAAATSSVSMPGSAANSFEVIDVVTRQQEQQQSTTATEEFAAMILDESEDHSADPQPSPTKSQLLNSTSQSTSLLGTANLRESVSTDSLYWPSTPANSSLQQQTIKPSIVSPTSATAATVATTAMEVTSPAASNSLAIAAVGAGEKIDRKRRRSNSLTSTATSNSNSSSTGDTAESAVVVKSELDGQTGVVEGVERKKRKYTRKEKPAADVAVGGAASGVVAVKAEPPPSGEKRGRKPKKRDKEQPNNSAAATAAVAPTSVKTVETADNVTVTVMASECGDKMDVNDNSASTSTSNAERSSPPAKRSRSPEVPERQQQQQSQQQQPQQPLLTGNIAPVIDSVSVAPSTAGAAASVSAAQAVALSEEKDKTSSPRAQVKGVSSGSGIQSLKTNTATDSTESSSASSTKEPIKQEPSVSPRLTLNKTLSLPVNGAVSGVIKSVPVVSVADAITGGNSSHSSSGGGGGGGGGSGIGFSSDNNHGPSSKSTIATGHASQQPPVITTAALPLHYQHPYNSIPVVGSASVGVSLLPPAPPAVLPAVLSQQPLGSLHSLVASANGISSSGLNSFVSHGGDGSGTGSGTGSVTGFSIGANPSNSSSPQVFSKNGNILRTYNNHVIGGAHVVSVKPAYKNNGFRSASKTGSGSVSASSSGGGSGGSGGNTGSSHHSGSAHKIHHTSSTPSASGNNSSHSASAGKHSTSNTKSGTSSKHTTPSHSANSSSSNRHGTGASSSHTTPAATLPSAPPSSSGHSRLTSVSNCSLHNLPTATAQNATSSSGVKSSSTSHHHGSHGSSSGGRDNRDKDRERERERERDRDRDREREQRDIHRERDSVRDSTAAGNSSSRDRDFARDSRESAAHRDPAHRESREPRDRDSSTRDKDSSRDNIRENTRDNAREGRDSGREGRDSTRDNRSNRESRESRESGRHNKGSSSSSYYSSYSSR